MGLFLGWILLISVSLIGVAYFAFWLLNRSAGAALTNQFRDAEFIVNQHHAPPAWTRPRRGFVWLMQSAPGLLKRGRHRPDAAADDASSPEKTRILKRMDELIRFFEESPFFEEEETRTLLLKELEAERTAWANKSLGEIVGSSDAMSSPVP